MLNVSLLPEHIRFAFCDAFIKAARKGYRAAKHNITASDEDGIIRNNLPVNTKHSAAWDIGYDVALVKTGHATGNTPVYDTMILNALHY